MSRTPDFYYKEGIRLLHNPGPAPSGSSAASRLMQAALGGHRDAQYIIGLMHYDGDHLPVDKQKAAEWWAKAAGQDHPIAQYNLAQMFLHGDGIKKNQMRAVYWLKRAADLAFADAEYLLGKILLKIDRSEGLNLLRLAARHGNRAAKDFIRTSLE